MSCRRRESLYASRIGVRGQVSSDETSESGSLYTSSGVDSSQTPSIVSSGSFHIHLTPNDFQLPLCDNGHDMPFGQFHEDNHTCDVEGCASSGIIAREQFGFHCAHCNTDVCVRCWPIDWTPESSQLSLNTTPTSSQSSHAPVDAPQAAPRLQVDADAAAFGRGHDA
jgi:hypothetical protein